MKQIVNCKRACIVDMNTDKVLYIFSYEYNKKLSDRDILCVLYNPRIMVWYGEELWFKNGEYRVEVYTEYKDKPQWFDGFVRWLFS